MRTDDFDYDLPSGLIAQEPAQPRDSCRLLVLDRSSGQIDHRRFGDVLEYLNEGDLLVVNETRVLPARLKGVKDETGGAAEVPRPAPGRPPPTAQAPQPGRGEPPPRARHPPPASQHPAPPRRANQRGTPRHPTPPPTRRQPPNTRAPRRALTNHRPPHKRTARPAPGGAREGKHGRGDTEDCDGLLRRRRTRCSRTDPGAAKAALVKAALINSTATCIKGVRRSSHRPTG